MSRPAGRPLTLARATALGLATGSRSQIGMAALALTQPAGGHPGGLQRLLAGSRGRIGFPLAAAGELVGDKLPKTPSRLEAPGLAARIVLGGLGGALLAARDTERPWVAATLGVTAALGTSYGGASWRRWASARFGRDLPGAVIEDVAAISLALAATRPQR